MYSLTREWAFGAVHDMGDGQGIHPHAYKVALVFEAEALRDNAYIQDFTALDSFGGWIATKLEGASLNEVLKRRIVDRTPGKRIKDFEYELVPPSSENLAAYIFGTWKLVYPNLMEVRVSGAPGVWVGYTPPSDSRTEPSTEKE